MHTRRLWLFLGSSLAMLLATSNVALSSWSSPSEIASFTDDLLPEASGIAQSSIDRDHVYLVNDGDRSSFVILDLKTSNAKTVILSGISSIDSEEIAVGDCPDTGTCIYIADIGDNKAARSSVKIYVVREQTNFGTSVTPTFVLTLTYPDDKGHNAEGFAIHPNGSAYLLTKEVPAQLFRLDLKNAHLTPSANLEFLGRLDLNALLKPMSATKKSRPNGKEKGKGKAKGLLPTGIAINPNGQEFAIVTKAAGVTIGLNLGDLTPDAGATVNQEIESRGSQISHIPLASLPQIEAISYTEGGDALIYTSEIVDPQAPPMPVMKVQRN